VIYRRVIRPLAFRLDPERAHTISISGLNLLAPVLARIPSPLVVRDPRLERTIMGVRFPNPVGLAAGYDKSSRAVGAWPALGFGFAEMGTVTALAQPGNARPRIFRLPADEALVNRLGFNNEGADAVARRLDNARRRGLLGRIPIGINVGKSKATDLDDATGDYLTSFRLLRPFADYFVVNVSSPNTPGLRELQDRGRLEQILAALVAENAQGTQVPLLVKLAPDLATAAVDEAVDLAVSLGIAGIVVANTTTARDGLRSPPGLAAEQGGLSGRPLTGRSTALIRHVANRAEGRLTIIGVGGVFDADDAWHKLAAGASLVQVYTGLIYQGPALARQINRGIIRRMEREGLASLDDIVEGGPRSN
jgi:dihydroorotate dehydrogenase